MRVRAKLIGGAAALVLAFGLGTAPGQASQLDGAHDLRTAVTGLTHALPELGMWPSRDANLEEVNEAVEIAQRRGRRGFRRGRGVRPRARSRSRSRSRDVGTGLAIGLGAAILSGALSQQRARAHEAEIEGAMYRCADRFRSFDWDSGTYVTYGGEVRLCPYLRPYFN